MLPHLCRFDLILGAVYPHVRRAPSGGPGQARPPAPRAARPPGPVGRKTPAVQHRDRWFLFLACQLAFLT